MRRNRAEPRIKRKETVFMDILKTEMKVLRHTARRRSEGCFRGWRCRELKI